MTGPEAVPVVLHIIGLAARPPTWGRTGLEHTYLVEYDPDRAGRDPRGHVMTAHIRTTRDPRDARHFPNALAAMEEWRRVSRRWPTRPDGKPNRPLTAFTVEVMRLDDAIKESPPDA